MPTEQRVLKLPLPVHLSRVETGVVQFGDDWPGLFLRGDNADSLMLGIRRLSDQLLGHPDIELHDVPGELEWVAGLIAADVIVPPAVKPAAPSA